MSLRNTSSVHLMATSGLHTHTHTHTHTNARTCMRMCVYIVYAHINGSEGSKMFTADVHCRCSMYKLFAGCFHVVSLSRTLSLSLSLSLSLARARSLSHSLSLSLALARSLSRSLSLSLSLSLYYGSLKAVSVACAASLTSRTTALRHYCMSPHATSV